MHCRWEHFQTVWKHRTILKTYSSMTMPFKTPKQKLRFCFLTISYVYNLWVHSYFRVQKSLLEPFLDSPTFNCDTIVNDLQVLRSDHNFICESISYRSDTPCEEPWIQLYSASFVMRSNRHDNLDNNDITEDLAIMQCNTFDDDEFSAILLIQKVPTS